LERYSDFICLEAPHPSGPPHPPDFIRWLEARERDDPSPPKCRINRIEASYFSPPESIRMEERTEINCSPTHCNVYIQAAGRGVNFRLDPKNLPQWLDFVEPVRRTINGFVIQEQLNPSSNTPKQ
jgi:hypothetical protein